MNLEKKKETIKVIQTKRFREHMWQRREDFIIPYYSFIGDIRLIIGEHFRNEEFIEIVVEHPCNIGYTNINKIENKDNIVFARRKGREIYSKFELNREKRLTNKYVVVLKQSYVNKNEFYLITMFPGEYPIKEVGDIDNIKTREEQVKVEEFWEENAMVFDKDIIDESTISKQNPDELI